MSRLFLWACAALAVAGAVSALAARPLTPASVTPAASTPEVGTAAFVPASTPLCPDHDPTKFHSLFDAERGCHYTHSHGVTTPHVLDGVFGPLDTFLPQEISYPWQTFKDDRDGQRENDLKHVYYVWLVRRNLPCINKNNEVCITDARILAHADVNAGGISAPVRFHSAWVQARGCLKSNPSVCGTLDAGGWVDYGHLAVNDVYVPLPNDPPEGGASFERRAHHSGGNPDYSVWYGTHQLFNLSLVGTDAFALTDPTDPSKLVLRDPTFTSDRNGSTLSLDAFGWNLWFDRPQPVMNLSGYTDRYGNIRPAGACSAMTLDCIPFHIRGLPPGFAFYADRELVRPADELDTSPGHLGTGDEWWLNPLLSPGVTPTPVVLPPTGVVTGRVNLEGRNDEGGALVEVGGASTVTQADGVFTLQVPPGQHTLTVRHARYLSRQTSITVASTGPGVALPPVQLVGGDGDGDDAVSLGDLILVAGHYNTAPPSDPRADMDGDGRVDLKDLTIVGLNYGKRGPQDWTTDANGKAGTPTHP